jgi:hypothetical protein
MSLNECAGKHSLLLVTVRMDEEGYRLPQSPWFFSKPSKQHVAQQARAATVPKQSTLPTQDSRYAGWAAPMNDGRLVTDYRSQCEANIPTGMQFATRSFLQTHAEEIMHMARTRHVEQTGASLPYNSVVTMPARRYVKCDTLQCYAKDGFEKGLGTERIESVPELFGTFSPRYATSYAPSQPSLTRKYEGGRNTVRGVF